MKTTALILGLALSANVVAQGDFYVAEAVTPEGNRVSLGVTPSRAECRDRIDWGVESRRYVSASCALVPEYRGRYNFSVYLTNHELGARTEGLGKMDCSKLLDTFQKHLQEGERATCSH